MTHRGFKQSIVMEWLIIRLPTQIEDEIDDLAAGENRTPVLTAAGSHGRHCGLDRTKSG
jgi:hypothetical protein